uniref:Ig-like domain-containing protein n=2 Tax=Sphaeramia orbicularis TaxID=375764 RepID=A0A672ZWI7_9TELE
MVIHQRHTSDESFSSSPVEIRITAATPIPELAEERSAEKPPAVTETPSDVPMTDDAQMKHKFTFSFDASGGALNVVRELENITCSEGNTAVLECEISGDPTPEATWYYDEISLKFATEKYRFEVDDKVYRLYINSFTYSDAGVYKCVARNKMGEVASIADVSFQVAEPGQFSEFGDTNEGNQRVRKPHD